MGFVDRKSDHASVKNPGGIRIHGCIRSRVANQESDDSMTAKVVSNSMVLAEHPTT